jgi:uncharacterized protein with HEPN domain
VIDRKVAKELLHVRDWLDRAQEIVDRGKGIYLRDDLLQEAGDSLMMKLGEASNRLSRAGIKGPDGVSWQDAIANRNWLIHQYDEIDRHVGGGMRLALRCVHDAPLRTGAARSRRLLPVAWRTA